jgi:hypothetical protein
LKEKRKGRATPRLYIMRGKEKKEAGRIISNCGDAKIRLCDDE